MIDARHLYLVYLVLLYKTKLSIICHCQLPLSTPIVDRQCKNTISSFHPSITSQPIFSNPIIMAAPEPAPQSLRIPRGYLPPYIQMAQLTHALRLRVLDNHTQSYIDRLATSHIPDDAHLLAIHLNPMIRNGQLLSLEHWELGLSSLDPTQFVLPNAADSVDFSPHDIWKSCVPKTRYMTTPPVVQNDRGDEVPCFFHRRKQEVSGLELSACVARGLVKSKSSVQRLMLRLRQCGSRNVIVLCMNAAALKLHLRTCFQIDLDEPAARWITIVDLEPMLSIRDTTIKLLLRDARCPFAYADDSNNQADMTGGRNVANYAHYMMLAALTLAVHDYTWGSELRNPKPVATLVDRQIAWALAHVYQMPFKEYPEHNRSRRISKEYPQVHESTRDGSVAPHPT